MFCRSLFFSTTICWDNGCACAEYGYANRESYCDFCLWWIAPVGFSLKSFNILKNHAIFLTFDRWLRFCHIDPDLRFKITRGNAGTTINPESVNGDRLRKPIGCYDSQLEMVTSVPKNDPFGSYAAWWMKTVEPGKYFNDQARKGSRRCSSRLSEAVCLQIKFWVTLAKNWKLPLKSRLIFNIGIKYELDWVFNRFFKSRNVSWIHTMSGKTYRFAPGRTFP